MTLTITIKMENSAFEDNQGGEAARILTKLADRIKDYSFVSEFFKCGLFDLNGNKVGDALSSDH